MIKEGELQHNDIVDQIGQKMKVGKNLLIMPRALAPMSAHPPGLPFCLDSSAGVFIHLKILIE